MVCVSASPPPACAFYHHKLQPQRSLKDSTKGRLLSRLAHAQRRPPRASKEPQRPQQGTSYGRSDCPSSSLQLRSALPASRARVAAGLGVSSPSPLACTDQLPRGLCAGRGSRGARLAAEQWWSCTASTRSETQLQLPAASCVRGEWGAKGWRISQAWQGARRVLITRASFAAGGRNCSARSHGGAHQVWRGFAGYDLPLPAAQRVCAQRMVSSLQPMLGA